MCSKVVHKCQISNALLLILEKMEGLERFYYYLMKVAPKALEEKE